MIMFWIKKLNKNKIIFIFYRFVRRFFFYINIKICGYMKIICNRDILLSVDYCVLMELIL